MTIVIRSPKFSDVDLSLHSPSICRITGDTYCKKGHVKKKSNGIILNLENVLLKRSPGFQDRTRSIDCTIKWPPCLTG